MKKREFLAMGGAVPLMLAGCGGDGDGNAPVRLLNASVGYPSLGFIVNTTQAVSGVSYGTSSPFETVQAGSVTTALTVATSANDGTTTALASTVRSLSKDSRYTLIAYGFPDELKSVLLTESTVSPDDGKANINVLNTSVDIGSIDVYLSTTPGNDLSVATLIATNVTGVTQSTFFSALPGSYYIIIVGSGSVAANNTDYRFTSPSPITLVNQEIVTIVVTPGLSGTLANAIVLVQGTDQASTPPTSFLNTTARLRAVTAVPAGTSISVGEGVLPAIEGPQPSNYTVVTTGAAPGVSLNGGTPVIPAGTLVAGGDYTLLVYTDVTGTTLSTKLIQDDNTAPVSTSGVKYRLINLAFDNQGSSLRMTVNNLNVATRVTFGTASQYVEIAQPTQVDSEIDVYSGTTKIITHTQKPVASTVGIFTDVIVSIPSSGDAQDLLLSTQGLATTTS